MQSRIIVNSQLRLSGLLFVILSLTILLSVNVYGGDNDPNGQWVADYKTYSTDLAFSDQVAIFAGEQSKEEAKALTELLSYIDGDNEIRAEEKDLLLELLHLPSDKWLTYFYQSTLYAEIDPVSDKSKAQIEQFLNKNK